jgi:hypothetical protein
MARPRAKVQPPAIGSRWEVRGGRGVSPSVYELVREEPEHDPIYRFVLRLESFDLKWSKDLKVGDEMHVEAAWFAVRCAMPANAEGSVRRVA